MHACTKHVSVKIMKKIITIPGEEAVPTKKRTPHTHVRDGTASKNTNNEGIMKKKADTGKKVVKKAYR